MTANEVMTEAELAARAERALIEQRWAAAVEDYRALAAVDTGGAHATDYVFNLGLALEGEQDRAAARDAFVDLARRFPQSPRARSALVRAASLDAYMGDWSALGAIGEALLARADVEDIERLVGLGSRGLARIELGDDAAATRDVLDGLELADRLHYGDRDVLPVAVAQLEFALGEVRRVRSERVELLPVPPDFLDKLEVRCGGLLEAQGAYAQAVRSVDPHWAAMAGYRVATMYRELHQQLMRIPPPQPSPTDRQKKVFYAFMHVRYRVLLEKALREIEQTIALGERTGDRSSWIVGAREAKESIAAELAEEQAALGGMPFTEGEVQKALALLQKRELDKQNRVR